MSCVLELLNYSAPLHFRKLADALPYTAHITLYDIFFVLAIAYTKYTSLADSLINYTHNE